MTLRGVRHRTQHDGVLTDADLQLFTEVEVDEPAEATAARPLP